MKKKYIAGTILICIGGIFLIERFKRHSFWKVYYANALGKPTNPLLVKALTIMPLTAGRQLVAIDLGCGVGNETATLLHRGFRVIAIDNQSAAVGILKSRLDIQDQLSQLKIIRASFEEIGWENLPKVDLIFALHSLPFCDRNEFNMVFDRIKNQIKEGGYFVGTFFDPNFLFFKNGRNSKMTFLNKDEILALFDSFEIDYFQENIRPARYHKNGKIVKTTEHTYEIIAQKRVSLD